MSKENKIELLFHIWREIKVAERVILNILESVEKRLEVCFVIHSKKYAHLKHTKHIKYIKIR